MWRKHAKKVAAFTQNCERANTVSAYRILPTAFVRTFRNSLHLCVHQNDPPEARMPEYVALYRLEGSESSGQAVLDSIRSSNFIDEINSGEGPREECGLYNLIQLVQPSSSSVKLASEKDVLEFHSKLVKGEETANVDGGDAKWNGNCILIADKEKDDLVDVLELSKEGKVESRLKAKARSSVEVVSPFHWCCSPFFLGDKTRLTMRFPSQNTRLPTSPLPTCRFKKYVAHC